MRRDQARSRSTHTPLTLYTKTTQTSHRPPGSRFVHGGSKLANSSLTAHTPSSQPDSQPAGVGVSTTKQELPKSGAVDRGSPSEGERYLPRIARACVIALHTGVAGVHTGATAKVVVSAIEIMAVAVGATHAVTPRGVLRHRCAASGWCWLFTLWTCRYITTSGYVAGTSRGCLTCPSGVGLAGAVAAGRRAKSGLCHYATHRLVARAAPERRFLPRFFA